MWSNYIQKTKGREPSELLKEAVDYARLGRALDLGAGAMNESRYLKSLGYEVTAVDSEPSVADDEIQVVHSTFNEYPFESGKFSLINARYSLPFNGPDLEVVVQKIKKSLAPGGIFVGQFFGMEDAWQGREGIEFHTKDEVMQMLDGLEILKLHEEKGVGGTALQGDKFWHVFDVIARKR